MRAWIRLLLVCIIVIVVPLPAWSLIIRTKDGKEYKGHLVKSDSLKVTVRLDGSDVEKSFFRFDISDLVQSVQPQQLEKLKPEDPKGYYNYALGLIEQQEDPEARDTALRLFLVAAYLDPSQYGHTALMKMSQLARSSEEANACRAMAFLLSSVADKSTLQKATIPASDESKARDSFLQALELLRRGKTKEALKYGEEKGVAAYFGVIPGLMSHQEFMKLCKDHPECTCTDGRAFCGKCAGKGYYLSNKTPVICPDCKGKGFTICKLCKGKPRGVKLAPLQLQIILQLELLNASDPKAKLDGPTEAKSEKWSALLSGSQIRPIPVLSLIYLTEFDPRKCLFKNGKWVEP